MHEIDLKRILRDVKALIYDVGSELRNMYRCDTYIAPGLKGKGELVTKADRTAEILILKELQHLYPYFNIYSEEEGGDLTGPYVWVVDPLDGTTNFVMRVPFWNVSISLVDTHNKHVLLGVVYAPMFEKMYCAYRGGGAYLNGYKITVNKTVKELEEALHVFCYGSKIRFKKYAGEYYTHMLAQGYTCRQLGAAQLELSYIAEGILHTMFIPGANVYDVAAGTLLVTEAGGVVRDNAKLKWYPQGLHKTVWAASSPQLLDKLWDVASDFLELEV